MGKVDRIGERSSLSAISGQMPVVSNLPGLPVLGAHRHLKRSRIRNHCVVERSQGIRHREVKGSSPENGNAVNREIHGTRENERF